MKIITETERLYLREMTEDDAENAFLLNNDPDVVKYTGDKPFENIEEARTFLRRYSDYRLYGVGRWAIILKETGEFLGWCGLKYLPGEKEYDLGFRLSKRYWHKGYATEAAKACIQLAFTKLRIQQLLGRALKANIASIKVLQKLGFKYVKSDTYHDEEGVEYRLEKG